MSINAGTTRPRSRAGAARGICGQLLCLHFAYALHVALAYGVAAGTMQWLCPLAMPFFGLALSMVFPAFAMRVFVLTVLLFAVGLGMALRFAPRWPVLASRWMLLAALAWLPLLSGEIVRSFAMHAALREAGAEAYSTRTLWTSLRGLSGTASTHAWMRDADGGCHRWSYRKMAFYRLTPDVGEFVCRD